MFCENCGNKLKDGNPVCESCGRVSVDSTFPSGPSAPAPAPDLNQGQASNPPQQPYYSPYYNPYRQDGSPYPPVQNAPNNSDNPNAPSGDGSTQANQPYGQPQQPYNPYAPPDANNAQSGPYPGYIQQPYNPYAAPGAPIPKSAGQAVTCGIISVVIGAISFLLFFAAGIGFFSFFGLPMGIYALALSGKSNKKGTAVALGVIGVILGFLSLIFYIAAWTY